MSRSRVSYECTVRLDNATVENARVISVRTYAGASNSDTAVFEVRPTHTPVEDALEFTSLRNTFVDKACEIWYSDVTLNRRIFWGRTTAGSLDISPQGEVIRFTARLEPHLAGGIFWHWFGRRSRTQPSDTPIADWVLTQRIEDAICNPIMDGIVVPNMLRINDQLGFLRVESIDQEELELSRQWIGGLLGGQAPELIGLGAWTLTDIVEYLLANIDATTIIAPPRSEYEPLLGTDVELVRNHKIAFGDYPVESLDAILTPYGFSWRYLYDVPNRPRIEIYKRGNPDTGTMVMLQAAGEQADWDLSQVEQLNADFDLTDEAANAVLILGDYEYREGVFELVPAWHPAYDTMSGADAVVQFMEGSLAYESDALVRRVWREWVLNEGGDYIGLRPSITEAYSFDGFFDLGEPLVERRRFYETLTRNETGSAIGNSHGILIEWSKDGGITYNDVRKAVTDGGVENGESFQLLTDECGVRFDAANHFPWEMYAAGPENCKLRVTATVRNDHRLYGYKDASSLHSKPRPLVIDASDRYHYRKIHDEENWPPGQLSFWRSPFRDMDNVLLSEADDTEAINKLAEDLLLAWNRASLNGRITLFGVWPDDTMIGRTVTEVWGRGITLELTHQSAPSQYPTIQSIELDFQNQQTNYFLDSPKPRR